MPHQAKPSQMNPEEEPTPERCWVSWCWLCHGQVFCTSTSKNRLLLLLFIYLCIRDFWRYLSTACCLEQLCHQYGLRPATALSIFSPNPTAHPQKKWNPPVPPGDCREGGVHPSTEHQSSLTAPSSPCCNSSSRSLSQKQKGAHSTHLLPLLNASGN